MVAHAKSMLKHPLNALENIALVSKRKNSIFYKIMNKFSFLALLFSEFTWVVCRFVDSLFRVALFVKNPFFVFSDDSAKLKTIYPNDVSQDDIQKQASVQKIVLHLFRSDRFSSLYFNRLISVTRHENDLVEGVAT